MKRSSETSSTGDEAAPPPRVVHTVPLAEEGDGGEDGERDEVAVDAEDDLVHARVQDGLGEDVVAAEGELDEDNPGVRPPCRVGAQLPREPLEQSRLPLVALVSHLHCTSALTP